MENYSGMAHPRHQLEEKKRAWQEATALASDILIRIRRRYGLSQAELAEKCGRRQSYISRVESRQQNVSLATLIEIVNATGAELSIDLVDGDL